MLLPQYFLIQNHQISVFLVFLILAILVSLYVFWREMVRDGFDEERTIDLFVGMGTLGYVASRIFFGLFKYDLFDTYLHVIHYKEPGENIYGFIIGVLIAAYPVCKLWRWSVYRTLDNIALAVLSGVAVLSIMSLSTTGELFFALTGVGSLTFYFFFRHLRLKFRAGLVFSLTLFGYVFLAVIRSQTTFDLLFYIGLITIGLVNLYFREQRNPMKSYLPTSYIKRVARFLKRKEKALDAEQKLLIEEDPYMAPGRTEDNELLDDVSEDVEKEISDLRLGIVASVRKQVRKALARIKIGKYGLCEVCGERINKARLDAYPEATTCLKHSA